MKVKSIYWTYFDRSSDKKAVTCRICQQTFNHSGSTTNLRMHMQRHHGKQYRELRDSDALRSDNNDTTIGPSCDNLQQMEPEVEVIVKWPHDSIVNLIKLYRKKPILWNPYHPPGFLTKQEAWEDIASKFSTDANIVKKKISQLLRNFRRRDASGRTEWIYYRPLMFLKAVSYVKNDDTYDSFEDDNNDDDNDDFEADYLPVKMSKSNSSTHGRESEITDELDKFGEYIASALRRVKKRSLLNYAKMAINDIIYCTEVKDQRADSLSASVKFDPIIRSPSIDAQNEEVLLKCDGETYNTVEVIPPEQE